MPQRLDLGDLGEEPVAADVEAPALALGGAADPAHHGVALEHRHGRVPLDQLVRGRQPGRPRPDDEGVGGLSCPRSAHAGTSPFHSCSPRRILGGWSSATVLPGGGRVERCRRPAPGARRVHGRARPGWPLRVPMVPRVPGRPGIVQVTGASTAGEPDVAGPNRPHRTVARRPVRRRGGPRSARRPGRGPGTARRCPRARRRSARRPPDRRPPPRRRAAAARGCSRAGSPPRGG